MSRLLIVVLLLFVSSVNAETRIQSGDKQVSLLELYTSEGCSSCPPADKWLSELTAHPGLWSSVVPVAFHVDYWDYIGWDDRFASPEYSARQRRYASAKNLRTVYTPGFLLNGEEWRSFFGLRKLSLDDSGMPGQLNAVVDGQSIDATYITKQPIHSDLMINIAVLGFDIKTDVKAGENRNRQLIHDFVVLGHKVVPLFKQQGRYVVKTDLPELKQTAMKKGIALWVNKQRDLTPIQAAGNWLQ